VIPNAYGALNAIPPPQENKNHVDHFPSLPISYSFLSSSIPGERRDTSYQVDKNKRKSKNKEKKNKQ
jgi:hypothetical protein